MIVSVSRIAYANSEKKILLSVEVALMDHNSPSGHRQCLSVNEQIAQMLDSQSILKESSDKLASTIPIKDHMSALEKDDLVGAMIA